VWTNSAKNTDSSKSHILLGARIIRALFTASLLFTANAFGDTDCNTNQFDEITRIKSIIDGDTLLLEDERLVRLIGINSPELNEEHPPAEPFADQAKITLQNLLKNIGSIGLIRDQEKRDRYQRILAHAFLPNGTNLQSEMLRVGMGVHVFMPPNEKFFDCYRRSQAEAMTASTGIWSHPRFQDHDAEVLTLRHLGYYTITGRIREITTSRHSTWLVVTDRFAFRIENEDLKYFKKQKPETLRTHTVRVGGWIFPYNSGLNMRILHPKNIEILD